MADETWFANKLMTPRRRTYQHTNNALQQQQRADSKTVSQIQQQVMLILHAQECQRLASRANGQRREQRGACGRPSCESMRHTLNHLTTCQQGKKCPMPSCSVTRQHLTHWNYCKKKSCPACSPIRAQLQLESCGGGAPRSSMQDPWFTTGGVQTLVGTPEHQAGSLALMKPVSFSPAQSVAFDLVNPEAFAQPGQLESFATGAIALGDDAKNWRLDVTYQQRNLFVYTIIHAAFRFPDPEALFDDKMVRLEQLARSIEDGLFERANSRAEYAAFVSQKIAELKAEFDLANAQQRGQQEAAATLTSSRLYCR